MAHLHHFCSLLPQEPYVDQRPAFSFDKDDETEEVMATVTLPNSVDPAVRRASGLNSWKTERMARRDAAFQAYIALYSAGLVNDHLLPLIPTEGDNIETEIVGFSVKIDKLYIPWITVCDSWKHQSELFRASVVLKNPKGEDLQMYF